MTPSTMTIVLGLILLAPLRVIADGSTQFSLWAMEANKEGRKAPHFDTGLEAVQDAVKTLEFDTYLRLKTDDHTFEENKEYRTPINDQYSLSASAPVAQKDGRYRMKIKITMTSTQAPKKEIEALDTELLLQPGKKVLVRGLKLGEDKEMVVVLALTIPKPAT